MLQRRKFMFSVTRQCKRTVDGFFQNGGERGHNVNSFRLKDVGTSSRESTHKLSHPRDFYVLGIRGLQTYIRLELHPVMLTTYLCESVHAKRVKA